MTGPISDFMGYVGVAFYLVAYGGLQLGLLRGSGFAYTLLNLAAAIFVLISLTTAFNMSSFLVQSFWIVASLFGIGRQILLRRRLHFSEEDRGFLDSAIPGMPKPLARKLLNRGVWTASIEGRTLLDEGAPVDQLFYILDGRAEVLSHGRKIGDVTQGFVGEMNVMSGGPATATVRVAQPGRLLTFPADQLRTLARQDPELRLWLDSAFSSDTHGKLVRANRALSDQTGS